jgi:hypothetical protein
MPPQRDKGICGGITGLEKRRFGRVTTKPFEEVVLLALYGSVARPAEGKTVVHGEA